MLGVQLGELTLEEPIGSGGMATVWRGVHAGRGLPVAVKILTRRATFDATAALRSEVRAVARMDHPNVILVFDQGTTREETEETSGGAIPAGQPYLAMELCTGGTLRDLVDANWPRVGALLRSVLRALAHAHARGVIHRDLKPANVLVPGRGDLRPGIKLTDFGIAYALEGIDTDVPHQLALGTLRYLAPERIGMQIRDEGPWTDLYALGMIAYRLVSGRLPFGSASGTELARCHLYEPPPPVEPTFAVPPGLAAWIARLIAKRPVDRFATAREARCALDNVETDAPAAHGRVKSRRRTSTAPPPTRNDDRTRGFGLGLFGLRPPPLIGRQLEREHLSSALSEVVASGTTRVAVVRGAPGCGKSRLCDWMAQRAHEDEGATVLRAGHGALGGAGAGLRRMLAVHLRCLGLDRRAVQARVASFLETAGGDGFDALAIAEIIAPAEDAGDAPTVQMSAAARDRVVRRVLSRLAARGPVVLVFDDAQWSADALPFCEYLVSADAGDPIPILAIAALRDDAPAPVWPGGAATTMIDLDPLPRPDQLEIIGHAAGLSGSLAARVADRAAGSPLFAIELIADWVARGVLRRGVDGYQLADDETAEIPDHIHALCSERIRAVVAGCAAPQVALTALEIAACLGPDVDAEEWSLSCRGAGVDIVPGLVDGLLAARLAEPADDGWMFNQPLVSESLERSATEAGRLRGHHAAIADMLAGRSAPVERRARHLVLAGEFERAIAPLLAAAERRVRSGEMAAAHALFDERERALDEVGAPARDRRWAEGWVARAGCMVTQGRLTDAEALAMRAATADRSDREMGGRAATVRGAIAFRQGDAAGSHAIYSHALTLLEGSDGDALAACLAGIGSVCMWRRNLSEARRHYARLAELGSARADRDTVGLALRGLAQIEHCQRDFSSARQTMQLAMAELAEAGNRYMVALATNDLGELARQEGDIANARALYRDAAAMLRAIGAGEALVADFNLGMVLIESGATAQARELLTALLAEIERSERTVERLWVDTALLTCAAAEGDFAAFDAQLARVETPLRDGDLVDEDLAMLSRRAGDLAAERQQPARAAVAYRLSLAQYQRMEHGDQIEAIEALLARLPR